ncbi:unnamed protein product, partial [Symbiodinium microadriaticum]
MEPSFNLYPYISSPINFKAASQSSYTTHPGIIAAEACSLLAFLIIRALKRQGEENQMTAKDFLDKVTAEYLSVSGLENKSGW